MTEAKSIEDMRAELEAAGINPYTAYMAWETASKEAQVKAIRANYEKYQREKHYAEMEKRVERLEKLVEDMQGDGK